MFGSQIKSLIPLLASLKNGRTNFLISQISMFYLLATVKTLPKDSIFMGISLDIQLLIFFPFLKSKIPQSNQLFDLLSRLMLRQQRQLLSCKNDDFFSRTVYFSGQFISKQLTVSRIEQMTCEVQGLNINLLQGVSDNLSIFLLPSHQQLIECFWQLWWYFEKSSPQPRLSMRPVNQALELDSLMVPLQNRLILLSKVMKYCCFPYHLRHLTLMGGNLIAFLMRRWCLISIQRMSWSPLQPKMRWFILLSSEIGPAVSTS